MDDGIKEGLPYSGAGGEVEEIDVESAKGILGRPVDDPTVLGKNEFKIELFGIDTGRLGGPCRIKKGVDKPLIVVGGLGVVGLGGF